MNEDGRRVFTQRCLNALARREYSRAELAARGDDVDDAVVAAVLDELAAKGWQSDARFVEQFVRSKVAQGQGRLKIRQALRQKGIGDALAREALDEIDWQDVARAVYAKKYTEAVNTPAERAKRQRFMAQRGFTFDDINAVFKNND